MITLQNNTCTTFVHNGYKLEPKETLTVPKEIAVIWLKIKGINEFVDPKEAKAKDEKAQKEKEALEKENADLKAKLAELEKEATAKEEKAKK